MSVRHPIPGTRRRRGRGFTAATALLAASLVAAGCGSEDSEESGSKGESGSDKEKQSLVVYSGREEKLVDPLYKQFEESTGIELEVRYADSPAMAAQILEEGDKSPADVFYSQDAGAIGAVEAQLQPLPAGVADAVPAQFRDDAGRWTGVTGRTRTLVYNTDELKEADLPTSVLDVTDEKWNGKVGVAPTNASFIAFVSALRLAEGDAAAKTFLEGLVDNDAKVYEKNGAIVDAVAKGEVQVGLVNHYYLYEMLAQDADAPIANHFFADGDVGNMVNVSAIGILESTDKAEEARQLVEFMLDEGQEFIVNDAPEREYPLGADADITANERYRELPPLANIKGPDIELSDLGAELDATVTMIRESGLAT